MIETRNKTSAGNFFEDFAVGQEIRHATPRTLTVGDSSLYVALHGSRFALQSSAEFARRSGLRTAPIDDLLTFHVILGKTVPDISLNAVANLGYAGLRFLRPVFPGDTLSAESRIVGLKENSNRQSGIVYVQTTGQNQDGAPVLEYHRWVMVRKRDAAAPVGEALVPELPGAVTADQLIVPEGLDFSDYDAAAAGSPHFWEDYGPGEKIDHVDGMTIEAAEHMMATRLYQNTARVHFNLHVEREGRLGERIVYGGHVISLARALSFNGLANAQVIAAINGGRHVNPTLAGDTIYAWSEVLDKAEVAGRRDLGALRLRLVAVKNAGTADFPHQDGDGRYLPSVVLDLDYWALMPRRS